MNVERLFASSSAFIGTRSAGPGTRTSELEKAGACPQLYDATDRALATDGRHFSRSASAERDRH